MVQLFFIGVILTLSAIVFTVFSVKKDKKKLVFPCIFAVILGGIIIAISCVASVPTGHTGIVTTFGQVEDYTFEAGIHFKLPWQEVVNMDNRNQKATIDLSCFSSDIQEVEVTYTINYQIQKSNAQTIYKTIGTSYFTTVISPRIQEAVKSVIAQYNAENLIANREKLSAEVKEILLEKLALYNIEVLDASIENLDFSDVFTAAVEAKQVAEQTKLKTQIEQEQAIIIAEAEAERAKIEAEAAAEVKKIEADAKLYATEKEAEANAKLSASLTESLIKYFYTQSWDGKLPIYMGGDGGTSPILDLTEGVE
ncbi:MAG: prohibitin family protein [Clostridia bacterium]|nr:prohibitin family protein [Clostridia bacterium]